METDARGLERHPSLDDRFDPATYIEAKERYVTELERRALGWAKG